MRRGLQKACFIAVVILPMCSAPALDAAIEKPACFAEVFDLWPLAYVENRMDATRREFLGPLGLFQHTEFEEHIALRPLFYHLRNPEQNTLAFDFVWPFLRYRLDARESSFQIFPLFYHFRREHHDSVDTDSALFPLIFWGSDTRKGPYLLLIPFGGMLKGSMGRDWIRFVFFPLWMDSHVGTRHAWNFLFPFFAYQRDPAKKMEGLRIFPLYARLRKEKTYDLRWFLWPLVSCSTTHMDRDIPTKTLLIFPLYGRSRGDGTRMDAVFWPFFSRRSNAHLHFVEWNLPWPIWKYAEGDGIHERRIWPFWSTRQVPGHRRDYYLWPFIWNVESRNADMALHTFMFLPFYWQSSKVRHEDDGDAVQIKRHLWPLWRYQKDADGTVSHALLAPLWFSPTDEAERNWGFLWSLFGYSGDREGSMRTHLLWRFIRYERSEEAKSFSLFPLVDYRRDPCHKAFQILKGLFAYERGPGYKKLRILFVPVTLSGEANRRDRSKERTQKRRERLSKRRIQRHAPFR